MILVIFSAEYTVPVVIVTVFVVPDARDCELHGNASEPTRHSGAERQNVQPTTPTTP